jgi:hypothetical protein
METGANDLSMVNEKVKGRIWWVVITLGYPVVDLH